jgi:hypothetical protein
LLEEVPSLRINAEFEVVPLTEEFCFGTVVSLSRNVRVGYELQFFHLQFLKSPLEAINTLSARSANVLVPISTLFGEGRFKRSQLIDLLNSIYIGGPASMPWSWLGDLATTRETSMSESNLEFKFLPE